MPNAYNDALISALMWVEWMVTLGVGYDETSVALDCLNVNSSNGDPKLVCFPGICIC